MDGDTVTAASKTNRVFITRVQCVPGADRVRIEVPGNNDGTATVELLVPLDPARLAQAGTELPQLEPAAGRQGQPDVIVVRDARRSQIDDDRVAPGLRGDKIVVKWCGVARCNRCLEVIRTERKPVGNFLPSR